MVLNYIHKNFYYNSSYCNNTPYSIEIIDTEKCNNSLNMCVIMDNHSIYKTCYDQHNIISNNSSNILNILLTIFILFLVFIFYKLCCQSCTDDTCRNCKYKIEKWFGCNKVIPYSEYNRL